MDAQLRMGLGDAVIIRPALAGHKVNASRFHPSEVVMNLRIVSARRALGPQMSIVISIHHPFRRAFNPYMSTLFSTTSQSARVQRIVNRSGSDGDISASEN